MVQTIILTRKNIKFHAYYVKMKIHVKKPAGFYGIIALLAQENDDFVNEAIICDQFRFTHSMAKTALNRCVSMDLLDEDYYLTETGLNIAEEGQMYQPEETLYKIFLTSDPLLQQRIIGLQRILDDKNIRNKPTETKNLNINNIEVQNLLMVNKENDEKGFIHSDQIIIEECASNLIPDPKSSGVFDISCEISLNNVRMNFKGKIGKSKFKNHISQIPANFNYIYIKNQLLQSEGLLDDYDDNLNAIRVEINSNEISKKDFLRFLHSYRISSPKISNFGNFEPTTLKLKIIPKTKRSMLLWELELLFDKIHGIISNIEYITLKSEIRNIMEMNSGESLELPSLEEIAKYKLDESKIQNDYGPRDKLYWYLQSTLDLPYLE